MKFKAGRNAKATIFTLLSVGVLLLSFQTHSQVLPVAPPVLASPVAPAQAAKNVRTRVEWLKNATVTAPSYSTGGAGLVARAFETLRLEYSGFARSLGPQQRANGANELAELAAGLDIIQEAFSNFEQDRAAGRSEGVALRELCDVIAKAADVWLREFNQDCVRLRVSRL